MATATLLLPARHRLTGQPLPADVAAALGRADVHLAAAGEYAQLGRQFQCVPAGWPVAALTRQWEAGDAEQATWLRADPARVSPDMHGARLLAHGQALGLEAEDVAQLLPALTPLFGDAGLLLDAPHPARWYLRLPVDAPLPVLAPINEVLGDDLFAHLPAGEGGRRWRTLLTEAQIILHHHPWNAQRTAAGKPPINSLWFWGAGRLPHAVHTSFHHVKGQDALLRGLAQAAGVRTDEQDETGDTLIDLRHLRPLEVLVRDVLQPLLAALAVGDLHTVQLDFEDGACFTLRRAHRWRVWRRPRFELAERSAGLDA